MRKSLLSGIVILVDFNWVIIRYINEKARTGMGNANAGVKRHRSMMRSMKFDRTLRPRSSEFTWAIYDAKHDSKGSSWVRVSCYLSPGAQRRMKLVFTRWDRREHRQNCHRPPFVVTHQVIQARGILSRHVSQHHIVLKDERRSIWSGLIHIYRPKMYSSRTRPYQDRVSHLDSIMGGYSDEFRKSKQVGCNNIQVRCPRTKLF